MSGIISGTRLSPFLSLHFGPGHEISTATAGTTYVSYSNDQRI